MKGDIPSFHLRYRRLISIHRLQRKINFGPLPCYPLVLVAEFWPLLCLFVCVKCSIWRSLLISNFYPKILHLNPSHAWPNNTSSRSDCYSNPCQLALNHANHIMSAATTEAWFCYELMLQNMHFQWETCFCVWDPPYLWKQRRSGDKSHQRGFSLLVFSRRMLWKALYTLVKRWQRKHCFQWSEWNLYYDLSSCCLWCRNLH